MACRLVKNVKKVAKAIIRKCLRFRMRKTKTAASAAPSITNEPVMDETKVLLQKGLRIFAVEDYLLEVEEVYDTIFEGH